MDFFTKLPPASILRGRQDFVIEQCTGKRVLELYENLIGSHATN
jgi:hypothetical protein